MIGLLLALGAKRPEPAPPPAPPPPAPWSDAWLAAATAEVVPAIERAAGRAFTAPPGVQLATPEAFSRVWKEEERVILGTVLRQTPPEVREAMIGDVGLPPGLLGKYAVFDRTLFLCREAVEAAAAEVGVSPERMARVVLAHELVHALHGQHVDLAAQVGAAPDLDAFQATGATSEGLATWVAERVAAELGYAAEAEAMRRLQGWGDAGLLVPEKWPVYASYGLGRDAMAWHFAHGGLDEVWAVAARPPTLTAGVYRPETWADPRPTPSRDWSATLVGVEQQLTTGPWALGVSVLGEYDLLGEAVRTGDPGPARAVLAHLREAYQLDASRQDREGEVRVLVFDGPTGPGDYLDRLRTQQEAEAERLTARGLETEIAFRPFDDKVAGDRSVVRTSRLAGAEGVSTERESAWVARGPVLVVVSTSGFRPGNRLAWAVEEVFRRLGPGP